MTSKEKKKIRDRERQEEIRRKFPNRKRWEGMRARCLNPRHKSYQDYGGRGIKIYSPWVNSFEAFDLWLKRELGDCPNGMTLDRIDNDDDYRPGNLRWAPFDLQLANRRK